MLSRWQSTIVDAQGNVQPLANLTVRNEADQSLAKMWASPGTTQPLPDGMLQADGNGYAYFYAEGGLYRITSVALGIDWRHVPLGELAHMDVDDLGLGTAATLDVGTGADDVPTNDDLGSAATLDVATTEQAEDLIDDDVVITPKSLGEAMDAHVLGMGQTWQDVLSQRAPNTSYTNTTGRAIAVSISLSGSSSTSVFADFLVDGVRIARVDSAIEGTKYFTVFGIVPSGSAYRVNPGPNLSLGNWAELR